MKDLGVAAAVILAFSVIVFGAVTAGAETSDGSNTRNGVSQPPMPEGVQVEINRLEAPSGG